MVIRACSQVRDMRAVLEVISALERTTITKELLEVTICHNNLLVMYVITKLKFKYITLQSKK